MRRETPETTCTACYGAGTRVEVHRSRYELERVLSKYGADDVLFVEADASSAIQFVLRGRYVQLAFPLPNPEDARFTHTRSGKPRSATGRERAYDQALREHWRSLIVAVRGKLQSVESGISTFEQEFDRFLIPQFALEKRERKRRKPKAVNWLLGGSHTVAIALVAAFLVPASAVGAFALPTDVVGQLAVPFRSTVADESSSGESANGVALARGDWSPLSGDGDASLSDTGRLLLTLKSEPVGSGPTEPRRKAAPPAPASEPYTPPLDTPSDPPPSPEPPAPPSAPADPAPPVSDGGFVSVPPPPAPPVDEGDSPPSDSSAAPEGPSPSEPPADDSTSSPPPDSPPTDAGTPPDAGDPTPPGNGNGNGSGNGLDNGNGPGNGNGNGNGNGLGQGTGQGQGNGQGNGKGKGGK